MRLHCSTTNQMYRLYCPVHSSYSPSESNFINDPTNARPFCVCFIISLMKRYLFENYPIHPIFVLNSSFLFILCAVIDWVFSINPLDINMSELFIIGCCWLLNGSSSHSGHRFISHFLRLACLLLARLSTEHHYSLYCSVMEKTIV